MMTSRQLRRRLRRMPPYAEVEVKLRDQEGATYYRISGVLRPGVIGSQSASVVIELDPVLPDCADRETYSQEVIEAQ